MGSYGETVVGIYGIDVGEMQGNINWEQVKKEGTAIIGLQCLLRILRYLV